MTRRLAPRSRGAQNRFVSALGEVLTTIHDAHGTYRTLSGRMRTWSHRGGRQRAFDRHQEQLERQRKALSGFTWSTQVLTLHSRTPLPDADEDRFLVYCRRPDEFRIDPVPGGSRVVGGSTILSAGDQLWWHDPATDEWWTGSSGHGTLTQLAALCDPAPLLSAGSLELAGYRDRATRRCATLVIRDVPSGPLEASPLMNVVPDGATSYTADIDVEHGVAVRLAALLGDEEFVVLEFEELEFDVALDPGLFTQPASARNVAESHPRHLSVVPEVATQTAGFTVFELWPPPEGMDLAGSVSVTLPPQHSDRGPQHPMACIIYTQHRPRIDNERQIYLWQNPVEAWEAPAPAGWHRERADIDGQVVLVDRPPAGEERGGSSVYVERDGTRIRVAARLPLEELLDAAKRLRPIPPGPPPLVASP